jgi:hypothetical protein
MWCIRTLNKRGEPGAFGHACNPHYWRGRELEDMVNEGGHLRDPPLNSGWAWQVTCMSVIPTMQEA